MNIFIGYESAFEYWRSKRANLHFKTCKAKPRLGGAPTKRALDTCGLDEVVCISSPVSLVVADERSRRNNESCTCRIWSGPPGARSFVKIGNGLYVSSPEACFAQLATVLSLVQLVEVGFELCGTYAVDMTEDDGMRPRSPLTSAGSLCRYVSKLAGMHGCKQASKALLSIADGSASPMETVLVMLLCMPRSQGGYGLPMPNLNYRISTDAAAIGSRYVGYRRDPAAAGAYRACDLYWPSVRLGVEYDSKSHHTEDSKIVKDSDRRAILGLVNVSVITATGGQVFNARALDRVVGAIAKSLGVRLRVRTDGWMSKRFNLRSFLLDTHRPAFKQYSAVQNWVVDRRFSARQPLP